MDLKLKPCPFCGNKEIRVEILKAMDDVFTNICYVKADIRCYECNVVKGVTVAGMNYDACKKRIQEEWNKREV